MGTAIVVWRKKQNNYPPPPFCNVTDCLSVCLYAHPAKFLTGHKLKDDLYTCTERTRQNESV